MTTQLKNILIAVIALVIGVGIGYVMFHPRQTEFVGNVSPGTLNSTPRVAMIAGNGTATSTWFSLLNGDANDRIVTTLDLFIQGTGGVGSTSAEVIQCATSSDPTDLNSNTNYLLNYTAASTVGVNMSYLSSSSPGTIGVSTTTTVRDWGAGSYLNCVAGGSGVANSGITTSTTTEYLRIGYLPL